MKEEDPKFPQQRAQEKSFALGGFEKTPLALMQLVAPRSLHFHTDQAPLYHIPAHMVPLAYIFITRIKLM